MNHYVIWWMHAIALFVCAATVVAAGTAVGDGTLDMRGIVIGGIIGMIYCAVVLCVYNPTRRDVAE